MRIFGTILLSLLVGPTLAADYIDSAPVVSSIPLYQSINEPQQQCWAESVTSYEQQRSPGGLILGGIAGGLLGNTVGRGHGRTVATVGGAVIGAAVGDHIANRDNAFVAVTRPVQRCHIVDSVRQVLTGYQVTYYYNGRNTTVVLPYDPGPRVPLAIGVSNATGPAYRAPVVERITYIERREQVWGKKPHKRHRHHRDRDD